MENKVEALAVTKICNTCGNDKPLEEFSKHGCNVDGRQGKCKECDKAKCKKRYQQKKKERDEFSIF